MLKTLSIIGMVLLLSVSAFSLVTFSGDAGLLGVKNVGETTSGNNLDLLWGRVNLASTYTDTNFIAMVHLRIYPAGYGFDYVSGATYDTSTNAIVTTATNETKLQVIHGWAQYTISSLKIKMGVMPLKYNNGYHFGDYAQRSYGGSYLYPGALHNATMFIHDAGMLNSQVALGVNQKNLNKAYILVKETFMPLPGFSSSVMYRSNVFDLVHDGDAEVVHAMSVSACYNYSAGQKVYAEVGIRDMNSDNSDVHVPVAAGITVPTSGMLDIASLEIEYSAQRSDLDKPGLYWAAYIGKNIGKHFQVQTSVFTNSTGKEAGDLGVGAYMVAAFN